MKFATTPPLESVRILPKLALIIPLYNEEEILAKSINLFCTKLDRLKQKNIISLDSFIVFIDDGSLDSSFDILQNHINSNNIVALALSKNVGHQNALLAGLQYVIDKCDCAISIDCDLQQDIDKIDEFLVYFKNGCDIVFGVRKDRFSDGLFKKWSSNLFYKMMEILGVKIIKNHADYRLLSNKALGFLGEFKEVNLFLRGIVLEIGLKSAIVYFDVKKRELGRSKYSLAKMMSLATNGITSFSIAPLRIIFVLGFLIALASGIFGIYGICIAIFSDSAVPGWASVVVPVYFLGGIEMLSLGIIGEYLGKVYKESKARPRYLIDKILISNKIYFQKNGAKLKSKNLK
ncbi:MAG: glycosyltransferase family 2 protein [Helicobacteraceae bacterium]|nr:glycosyltransferase family 2 protein [Helicobacteraceae bacterium]